MRTVIEAERLGIRFHINRRRRSQIQDMLFRTKQPAASLANKEFWALRNISFSVAEGEAVGLVGANGSGKSTLLKLIAGVLLPDEGAVRVEGGVAPLIELTGGLVGNLSARDNIVLTAGLHGLSRQEVERRFDEIVEFAEVGEFLDLPTRHFSSGMKVRLAFSVVTSIDEPIVLVDEVLAVGDRHFKEKCRKRMEELVKSEGRTLFLVSHNEGDLKRFCTRGLYIRRGQLANDGPLADILAAYDADQDGNGKKAKPA